MINFAQLQHDCNQSSISDWSDFFVSAVQQKLASYTHGELKLWEDMLNSLPEMNAAEYTFDHKVSIGDEQTLSQSLSKDQITSFTEQLKSLHPWRKGPFELFGIKIDTEWRSDWKWERIQPHISSLKNRTILDVGCGNGYHCWRMLSEQPKLVLGIDPSQKFLAQFSIFKKYLKDFPIHLLPLGIEDMPTAMPNSGFDSVFSMGVLYHRKSPIQHLMELKNLLAKNGELILETLVIDGNQNQVLMPQDRYAQMRNVWFIPSSKALELWLARCGFKNIRTVDINQTSLEEQRTTDWMKFHSLKNFLDPINNNLTIEGYPAPKRAILIAENT